jgi:sugar phosphate isomerase/epimerase
MTISRRSFVRGVCVAGLAAGASWTGVAVGSPAPVATGKAPLKRKFKMTLSCGMIGISANPREAIQLAGRFGFEAVEPSADFTQISDAQLQDLLAELKAQKLVWGAAGLSVDFRGEEAAFASGMKRLPDIAKGLKRAGVTRMGAWIVPSHKTLSYEANFAQHARRLREAANVVGDNGIRLGLEYVGPKTSWDSGGIPFIHTMAKMKDLIAAIACDNVGFMLDSWHWYTAHETQADLLTLRNADVVCVHLNDAPPGIDVDKQMDLHRALPASTGVMDLKSFLGALVQIGYDGPIAAEPFDAALSKRPKDEAVAATAEAMKKAFALVE